jgi:hypothetical protein
MVFGGMPEREGKGMRCDAMRTKREAMRAGKREAESMTWTHGPAGDGVVQVHRVPVAAHRRRSEHIASPTFSDGDAAADPEADVANARTSEVRSVPVNTHVAVLRACLAEKAPTSPLITLWPSQRINGER